MPLATIHPLGVGASQYKDAVLLIQRSSYLQHGYSTPGKTVLILEQAPDAYYSKSLVLTLKESRDVVDYFSNA